MTVQNVVLRFDMEDLAKYIEQQGESSAENTKIVSNNNSSSNHGIQKKTKGKSNKLVEVTVPGFVNSRYTSSPFNSFEVQDNGTDLISAADTTDDFSMSSSCFDYGADNDESMSSNYSFYNNMKKNANNMSCYTNKNGLLGKDEDIFSVSTCEETSSIFNSTDVSTSSHYSFTNTCSSSICDSTALTTSTNMKSLNSNVKVPPHAALSTLPPKANKYGISWDMMDETDIDDDDDYNDDDSITSHNETSDDDNDLDLYTDVSIGSISSCYQKSNANDSSLRIRANVVTPPPPKNITTTTRRQQTKSSPSRESNNGNTISDSNVVEMKVIRRKNELEDVSLASIDPKNILKHTRSIITSTNEPGTKNLNAEIVRIQKIKKKEVAAPAVEKRRMFGFFRIRSKEVKKETVITTTTAEDEERKFHQLDLMELSNITDFFEDECHNQ